MARITGQPWSSYVAREEMEQELIFPLVEVSGSPNERVLQHGRAVFNRVRRSAQIYDAALQSLGMGADAIASILVQFRLETEAFEPAYVEEMQGIADGAEISFNEVLMINARTEIVSLARRHSRQPLDAAIQSGDECTGAAILPARSITGTLIQGQNWDNRFDCADTAIILRVLREDGPDVLTFVEAGGLARYGMNSAGIVLNGNGLASSRDYTQSGIPLPLVRRKALEQEHYAVALQIVAATPKACSCNVMLGTSLGLSVNLECAPDETFLQYPEDGLLVHANHWSTRVALGKLRETGMATSPESPYRDVRVLQALRSAGPLVGLDHLKQAFDDRHASPYSVCRPPRMGGQGYPSSTTATLLMEPAAGTMAVARMPCLEPRYATYGIARGSQASF